MVDAVGPGITVRVVIALSGAVLLAGMLSDCNGGQSPQWLPLLLNTSWWFFWISACSGSPPKAMVRITLAVCWGFEPAVVWHSLGPVGPGLAAGGVKALLCAVLLAGLHGWWSSIIAAEGLALLLKTARNWNRIDINSYVNQLSYLIYRSSIQTLHLTEWASNNTFPLSAEGLSIPAVLQQLHGHGPDPHICPWLQTNRC